MRQLKPMFERNRRLSSAKQRRLLGKRKETERLNARATGRKEAVTVIQKNLAEALKPDGTLYGFAALAIVLASGAWTLSYQYVLDIPIGFQQWDAMLLGRGCYVLFRFLLWCIFCYMIWRTFHRSKWAIAKQCGSHIAGTFIFGCVLVPFAILFAEDKENWPLGAILLFPILLTAFDCFRAAFWMDGEGSTFSYRLTKLRRTQSTASSRQPPSRRKRLEIVELSFAPLYMLVVLFALHGAVLGFEDALGKQRWVKFPDEKAKIAVMKTGDYWIVRDATRVNDMLFIKEESTLVKIDDPKFAKVVMTNERYKLRSLNQSFFKRLGEFGILGVMSLSAALASKQTID